MIDRRTFLSLGAATALLGPAATARAMHGRLYASCGADRDGRYFLGAFDGSGETAFRIPLAERGHDIAFHPVRSEAVVFARRPGTTMLVVDTEAGSTAVRREAAPGRHYYGHGVFTPDGRVLYVTENDVDRGAGMIGIYDAEDTYRRIGEFPTGGIGPHQLRLMPDGASLAIANGGILTRPDTGRAKLNIETMAPSLAVLSLRDGRPLWRYELPEALHKLSIRHLDVNRTGLIAFAMQYEGDVRDRVPLVAFARAGGEVAFAAGPADLDRQMKQYTGSVAFDRSGAWLAVSSPRGSTVGLWDAAHGTFVRNLPARDASGLAAGPLPGTFLLTGGDGSIRLVSAIDGAEAALHAPDRAIQWDNHLASRALSPTA